jgi:hypothetical protein
MFAKTILTSLIIVATQAMAALQIEVGAGLSQAQPVGDGGWYQAGLPHRLNLRTAYWAVGATDDIRPGLAWRAHFVNLGRFSSDAQACDRDEDYNSSTQQALPGCNVARYQGHGTDRGLSLTVEPYTTYQGWRFGLEAGPYVHWPQWHETVTGWKPAKDAPPMTITADNPGTPKLGAVVGFSVGQGAWSVSMRHYLNKCTPSTNACLWRSTTAVGVFFRFGD